MNTQITPAARRLLDKAAKGTTPAAAPKADKKAKKIDLTKKTAPANPALPADTTVQAQGSGSSKVKIYWNKDARGTGLHTATVGSPTGPALVDGTGQHMLRRGPAFFAALESAVDKSKDAVYTWDGKDVASVTGGAFTVLHPAQAPAKKA